MLRRRSIKFGNVRNRGPRFLGQSCLAPEGGKGFDRSTKFRVGYIYSGIRRELGRVGCKVLPDVEVEVGQVCRSIVLCQRMLVLSGWFGLEVTKQHSLDFKFRNLCTKWVGLARRLGVLSGIVRSRRNFLVHVRKQLGKFRRLYGVFLNELGVMLSVMRGVLCQGLSVFKRRKVGGGDCLSWGDWVKVVRVCYVRVVRVWKRVLSAGELEGLVSSAVRRGWLRYYWVLVDSKRRLSNLPLWVRAFGSYKYSWKALKNRPYPIKAVFDGQAGLVVWRNNLRCRGEFNEGLVTPFYEVLVNGDGSERGFLRLLDRSIKTIVGFVFGVGMGFADGYYRFGWALSFYDIFESGIYWAEEFCESEKGGFRLIYEIVLLCIVAFLIARLLRRMRLILDEWKKDGGA